MPSSPRAAARGLPVGRAHWQRDGDARSCNGCQQPFSLTRRRHHCRACGLVYCNSCCPKPSKPQFAGSAEAPESPRLVRLRTPPLGPSAPPQPARSLSPAPGLRGQADDDGEEHLVDGKDKRICTSCLVLTPDHATLVEAWEVGVGSFGTVHAGMLPDGRFCAVKHLTVHGSEAKAIRDFHKEITVMRRLRHGNIVQYLGSRLDDGKDSDRDSATRLTIYLEYVCGGSLSKLLSALPGRHLPLDNARVYTAHILDGLSYLHRCSLAHRDVKCDNILICSASGLAKLADFGAAWDAKGRSGQRQRGARACTFIGTPHWMAPEVFLAGGEADDGAYDAMKADVWSVGCTVFEMLSGRTAWRPATILALVEAMDNAPGADGCTWPDAIAPDQQPKDIADFLASCFKKNPADRMTTQQLAEHQFVAHASAITECYRAVDGRSVEGARPLTQCCGDADVRTALLPSGQVIAMKKTTAPKSGDPGDEFRDRLKEASLLQHIQHRHVVRYIGHCFQERPDCLQLTLYMEYVAGGSARELLDRVPGGSLPLSTVRVYTRHVLDALTFLHGRGIAHRSVSPQHVLISLEKGIAKLSTFTAAIDLGSARPEGRQKKGRALTFIGVPETLAPEVVSAEDDGYDPTKADIWSVGCTTWELYSGRAAWPQQPSLLTHLRQLLQSRGWPHGIDRDLVPPDMLHFLGQCFCRPAQQRPSADALFMHHFVQPSRPLVEEAVVSPLGSPR
eukprot:TRINITY_DN567_c2_g1_i1.p1 TRINITY_DN567_c2_g1~~TRINITY_DN567_c2_g1_i1.p1  ORF type:complete len:765 (+),score=193.08 TRINITY_DN567_c2_g1_i1:98-2296(+)